MDYSEILKLDNEYIMPTYARYPVAFAAGRGACLYGEDGKRYIDFSSGIGVNSLGSGNEEWAKAVAVQALMLAHTSNLFLHEPEVRLAKKLVEFSGLEGKVFFSNSGAEANEGMIKLARKYSYDKYGPGRDTVITLNNSFHGRTITTLSATGQPSFHNHFFPFTEGFVHCDPNMDSVRSTACGRICAVMLECIQGEGGVYEMDRSFLSELALFAAQRDWLLLIDEVQTGIGRTGAMFAYQKFGIEPDVFTLAKGLGGGLPIGAVVANKKCADVLGQGTHGSTFGANPVCCSAALAVLETVGDPDFLEEVERKGAAMRKKLLDSELPIVELRGEGLMVGMDLDGIDAKDLVKKCLENGLVTLTAKKALRLLPPLVVTDEEMDEGVRILVRSAKQLMEEKQ